MKAEVTYNAGKTYRIKGTKFEQGKTRVITDSGMIKKCQMTAGFSVRIMEADKPRKKKGKSRRVRPVVREAVSTEKPKKKRPNK
jgi:hypothetical protein